VADEARRARLREEQALSPEERVLLARRLAERELALFASASGLSLPDAKRRLGAFRTLGRRRSVANEP
jgi:hypothetical protein